MKKVRFSATDKKVFEALSSENLKKTGRVPEIEEVALGAAQLRQKHSEIQAYSKFKQGNGFSAGGTFQVFARIDNLILKELEATHEVSCGCGKELLGPKGHGAWLNEWAETDAGREYNAKGELV